MVGEVLLERMGQVIGRVEVTVCFNRRSPYSLGATPRRWSGREVLWGVLFLPYDRSKTARSDPLESSRVRGHCRVLRGSVCRDGTSACPDRGEWSTGAAMAGTAVGGGGYWRWGGLRVRRGVLIRNGAVAPGSQVALGTSATPFSIWTVRPSRRSSPPARRARQPIVFLHDSQLYALVKIRRWASPAVVRSVPPRPKIHQLGRRAGPRWVRVTGPRSNLALSVKHSESVKCGPSVSRKGWQTGGRRLTGEPRRADRLAGPSPRRR